MINKKQEMKIYDILFSSLIVGTIIMLIVGLYLFLNKINLGTNFYYLLFTMILIGFSIIIFVKLSEKEEYLFLLIIGTIFIVTGLKGFVTISCSKNWFGIFLLIFLLSCYIMLYIVIRFDKIKLGFLFILIGSIILYTIMKISEEIINLYEIIFWIGFMIFILILKFIDIENNKNKIQLNN